VVVVERRKMTTGPPKTKTFCRYLLILSLGRVDIGAMDDVIEVGAS
jgi:hypothetical protein